MEHYNKLTPAEAERLAILAEECGEVIQAIGKIQRHGWDSTYENGITNRAQLEIELGDVQVISSMMIAKDDIDMGNIVTRMDIKREKIKRYLHHN